MHDVIVLYNRPSDPAVFDAHYTSTHIPLVQKLPLLQSLSWGYVADEQPESSYYLVARLTYATPAAAAESLNSPAGRESTKDLANFAGAGVTLLNVTRHDG